MRAVPTKRPSSYMLAPMNYKPTVPYSYTMSEIVEIVSQSLEIPASMILAKGRQAEKVFARHIICYVARTVVTPTYGAVEITRTLPLDHSGICHGVKVVRGFLDVPCTQRLIIENILKKFQNGL